MADNLVVDSGIIIKWFVTEHDSESAIKVYQSFQDGDIRLLVPDLIFAEFGNILWKKRIYQNLSKEASETAIELFQQIPFQVTSSRTLFDSALSIALEHKRSFYDSIYLALGEKENVRFVTADEKLYNAVRNKFPSIILLSNWQR